MTCSWPFTSWRWHSHCRTPSYNGKRPNNLKLALQNSLAMMRRRRVERNPVLSKTNKKDFMNRNKNHFLICFPMKYWDFWVKSKSVLPLVVTSEITIFIFTVSKNGLFMNSVLKVLLKGLKCSILVRTYGEDINVPRWNCWRHLLCWRNAFSARDVRRTMDYHWLRNFFCADFLRFIALNTIWPHFLGTKECFYPILCPLNTLNKTKLTQNG